MQIQAKTGGILYDRGGKPRSNYPGLKPGKEFWIGFRYLVPLQITTDMGVLFTDGGWQCRVNVAGWPLIVPASEPAQQYQHTHTHTYLFTNK